MYVVKMLKSVFCMAGAAVASTVAGAQESAVAGPAQSQGHG